MKKQLFLSAAVLLTAGMIWMTGCKKDDTTPPVVTITGANPLTISLNNTSVADPFATATDDQDGDIAASSISSDWSSKVDVNLKGSYTVTYSATDAAGNVGTATRTVNVINDAEAFAGTYQGNETDINGPYTYVQLNTVTASTTVNNRITLTRLGDFANNTVYINVTGTTLTMPSQTVTNVGTGANPCDIHNRQSDGTGTKTATGFNLTYNDAKVAPCTGSRTNVAAVFVKQ